MHQADAVGLGATVFRHTLSKHASSRPRTLKSGQQLVDGLLVAGLQYGGGRRRFFAVEHLIDLAGVSLAYRVPPAAFYGKGMLDRRIFLLTVDVSRPVLEERGISPSVCMQ